MQIFVHHNNQQLGPFTEAEVRAQLASGVLSLHDYVWWQGQSTWIPLAQSPFGATAHVGTQAPTSGFAIFSLVCACASLFCVLTAIPAIIMGHLGLAEIQRNPALKGRGMALAGLIIGYIYVAIFAIVMFIGIVIGFSGVKVKSTVNMIYPGDTQNSQDKDTNDSSTNSPDQNSSTNAPPATTP